MFLAWIKEQRRRRVLSQPYPSGWVHILERNVYHYRELSDREQHKLRDDLRVLVAEKNWEGCGGLEMTEEIQVTIAGQAALLLLGCKDQFFDKVKSVLVYPDAYIARERIMTDGGVVLEGDSHREGEAWYRGPVVLSWADVLAGGRCQAGVRNLVLHEFAHQLDMENGRLVDGIPPMTNHAQYESWQRVMRVEAGRLADDCRRGRRTLLDCYGTKDIGEFFAVSTECFFQRPREMRSQHRELYENFRDFFRQDPASRQEGPH